MKILAATFAYNERPYLPYWKKYYESEGCELFVIDNESDDKTSEWLAENNVPHSYLSTNGAFHLHKLQAELIKKIHEIKPNWVIYTGVDMFAIPQIGIHNAVQYAENRGYNQIILECHEMVSTGEKHDYNMQKTYTRGLKYIDMALISKYDKTFTIKNDYIGTKTPKPIKLSGIIVNYGYCKTKDEQKQKLIRRQRAWDDGLPKNLGKHYLKSKERNWVFDKNNTVEYKELPEWEFIKKI